MRLLLDECVPKRLKRELRGHDGKTVQDMGWTGIKNGALLRLADGQFDALLTVDQGIAYQQNLSGLSISVVVMLAPSNDEKAGLIEPLSHLNYRVEVFSLDDVRSELERLAKPASNQPLQPTSVATFNDPGSAARG